MISAFISFSRQDQSIANDVASLLSQCGYSAFIDDEISVGSNYAEQLTKRLNASDVVIYIVSEVSLNSQWCRREIEYAKSKGKTIIPIAITRDILNGKSYQESIVFSLNGLVWDVKGRDELSSLLQRISAEKQARAIQPSAYPRSYAPTIPHENTNKSRIHKIGCFAIILLAVLIGAYFLAKKSSTSDNLPHHSRDESIPPSSVPAHEEIVEVEWVGDDYLMEDSVSMSDSVVVDPGYIAAETWEVSEPSIDNEEIDSGVSPIIVVDSTSEHSEQDTFIPDDEEYIEPISDKDSGSNHIWLFLILVIAATSIVWWIYSKRKFRVKLVSNKYCVVFADNEEVAHLTAKKVTFIELPKGEYYLVFKPIDDTIQEKDITAVINSNDKLIRMDFPESKPSDRYAIKCFIAGSTKLKIERNALRSGIAQIHNKWREKNYEILSYTYEDFERTVVEGGHQSKYDEFIENDATIAVFIICGEIGEFTIEEFEKALNAFKTGKHPQILVLNDINAQYHEQSEKLKARVKAQKQYWSDYDSINALKSEFMIALNWILIEKFFK